MVRTTSRRPSHLRGPDRQPGRRHDLPPAGRRNPAAYEPDLAMSLNNLSNHLAAAGRRNESERASQEASELGTHGAE